MAGWLQKCTKNVAYKEISRLVETTFQWILWLDGQIWEFISKIFRRLQPSPKSVIQIKFPNTIFWFALSFLFCFFFPLVFLRIRSAMIGLVHSSLFNSFPSIQYDRLHRIIQAQVKVQHIQYTPVWLVSAHIEPRLKNLMVHINTADLSQKKKKKPKKEIYISPPPRRKR